MSELLQSEEPDPPSGFSENYHTNQTYDGPLAGDTVLASLLVEEERAAHAEEELGDIAALSRAADELLLAVASKDVVSDSADLLRIKGNVTLRRRRRNDRYAYYFAVRCDAADEGYEYCRSWMSGAETVNWCTEELRHEPAAEVREKIIAYFDEQPSEKSRRKVGERVLAKLPRFIRTS